jgi:hypothetical protein
MAMDIRHITTMVMDTIVQAGMAVITTSIRA